MLSGLQKPDHGAILYGNRPIHTLTPQQRARALAYLPQRVEVAWPIRVAEMVALGRFAYGPALTSEHEIAAPVAAALAHVGASHLAHRSTAELSGGELALCALARIFAAHTPLMLLDEPVAALDPARQLSTMASLRTKVDGGAGVAMVAHDINLAVKFADRIVWMTNGAIMAESDTSPQTTIALVDRVFGVTAKPIYDEMGKMLGLAITNSEPSCVLLR